VGVSLKRIIADCIAVKLQWISALRQEPRRGLPQTATNRITFVPASSRFLQIFLHNLPRFFVLSKSDELRMP
jgi:hypothetical protein